MKQQSTEDCSRCSREGEAFHCFEGSYVFDIDMAREFVGDGRDTIELEPDDVRYSVQRVQINEGHIAHVDASIPGIVGHIFYPHEGELVHAHRLIDGHHRAARCLQLGIPFYVYILSEEESVRALRKAPKGAKPRKTRRKAPTKKHARI